MAKKAAIAVVLESFIFIHYRNESDGKRNRCAVMWLLEQRSSEIENDDDDVSSFSYSAEIAVRFYGRIFVLNHQSINLLVNEGRVETPYVGEGRTTDVCA